MKTITAFGLLASYSMLAAMPGAVTGVCFVVSCAAWAVAYFFAPEKEE